MGGPATPGAMVEQVIEGLRDKLSLDSAQRAMFDSAHAQTIAARDRMHASRTDIRSKVQAELAKPEPDLAAVSAILETAEEQGRSLRHQARDQWLKVYASLRAGPEGDRARRAQGAHGANGRDAGAHEGTQGRSGIPERSPDVASTEPEWPAPLPGAPAFRFQDRPRRAEPHERARERLRGSARPTAERQPVRRDRPLALILLWS